MVIMKSDYTGEALSSVLARLRKNLTQVHLDLPLPGAEEARTWAEKAVSQLDDYVIPRLRAIEAPLLTVVGGSTGAGKSTLVNSLVGEMVTKPGVIRPTTKAPVLIHNPVDAHWFNNDRVFPELARSAEASTNPRSLHIVPSVAVPQGLAILDAPDIDSVDEGNRTLADQLLSAADLWLFVTSAARYADAVPWDYLTKASERSAAISVVVNRVPPVAMKDVPEHLAQMMMERGLGESPLFAVPETSTDEQGLLPPAAIEPVRSWIDYLASSQLARSKVVMATLDGAISALEDGITTVADQIVTQTEALGRLKSDAATIFADAKSRVRTQSSDGSLLRGEVMARWQDFVGTGEFMRSLETTIGRARDRVTRFLKGEPDKALDVKVAVKSGLETLMIEAGQSAVERVKASWMADPAGRHLVEWSKYDIGTVTSDYPTRVEQAIRLWQADVLEIVSTQTASKRTKARLAALGINGVGVALMLVAFAHTAGVTGAEIGIAGGTAVLAQKVLELIFGDEAIRSLANQAGEKLGLRINEVLDREHDELIVKTLSLFPVEIVEPSSLKDLGQDLGRARKAEMARLEALVLGEEKVDSLEGVGITEEAHDDGL